MSNVARSLRRLGVLFVFAATACSGGGGGTNAVPSTAQNLSHGPLTAGTRLVWFTMTLGIAHAANFVDAYDPATQSVVKTFALDAADITPVVSPDSRNVFIPFTPAHGSAGDSAIADIDTTTLSVTTINLPSGVAGLTISPDGRFLYAMSAQLLKINTSSRTIVSLGVAQTLVQGLEHNMVVSPDGNSLYVLDGDPTAPFGERITAYDTSSMSVRGNFTVLPISTGVAISGDGHTLFVPGFGTDATDKMLALDAQSGAIVHTSSLPALPLDIVADGSLNRVFVSSDTGNSGPSPLDVFSTSDFHLIMKITLSAGTPLYIEKATHDLWFFDSSGLHRLDQTLCAGQSFSLSGISGGIMTFAVSN